MKKILKTQTQLIADFREQTSLLEEAIQKVNSGDFKYAKTLSAILRILVIDTHTNKPLLFSLAQKYNFEPKVVTDTPFGIKTTLLKDYLKGLYFISATKKIKMSNEEFIKIASQQDGGSHVDPEIDFGYQFANEGISMVGFPPKVLGLRSLASHVLKASKELLSVIESEINCYG